MTWWSTGRHADRRPVLLARNRIKAAIRAWFESQGFTEVEPDALCVSPGNETHLHAFATEARTEAGARTPLYLHTSPEFAMKKLLAAGETKIFSFAPVWRNREQGSALHAAEFTMLEWYRAGAPWTALFDDCAAIVRCAAEAAGTTALRWRGRAADPFAPFARLSVAEAFARYAGGPAPEDADAFSAALVRHVEPALGHPAPTILHSYPVREAALARPSPADPSVAERFELYACGVELANGFGELTDPVEQRRRFEADMDEKERLYGERYPVDEDFLAALAAMPPASGCALGFDRLVMLATGAARIEDVRWAPFSG